MDKTKTSIKQKSSLSRKQKPSQKANKVQKKQQRIESSIKDGVGLKEYDPVKNLLDINKMGAAIMQCFLENDTEGVLEIVENYLYAVNKTQFLKEASIPRSTVYNFSQICFPYLKEAKNPHIINIAPPIGLEMQWLRDHLSFSLGKYGMSLCTLGMSAEFKNAGIAVNSLWPQTNIATQRLKDHLSPKVYMGSRLPSIMADAAYELASRTSQEATGQFFIDETLLRESGITDFSQYAVNPAQPLVQTLFLPLKEGMIPISRELFR